MDSLKSPTKPTDIVNPTLTDILNYEVHCVSCNRFMTQDEKSKKIKQINELIIIENQHNEHTER